MVTCHIVRRDLLVQDSRNDPNNLVHLCEKRPLHHHGSNALTAIESILEMNWGMRLTETIVQNTIGKRKRKLMRNLPRKRKSLANRSPVKIAIKHLDGLKNLVTTDENVNHL